MILALPMIPPIHSYEGFICCVTVLSPFWYQFPVNTNHTLALFIVVYKADLEYGCRLPHINTLLKIALLGQLNENV